MTPDELIAIVPDLKGKLDDPAALAAFVANILPDIHGWGGFDFRDPGCESDGRCTWDGIDRRCACGNRRMEWVWEPKGKMWCAEPW